MNDIPLEFASVEQYFSTFFGPMFEEIRAEIRHGLMSVRRASYMNVRHLKATVFTIPKYPPNFSFNKIVLPQANPSLVNLHFLADESKDYRSKNLSGSVLSEFGNSDLVLLSNVSPKDLDLNDPASHCALGVLSLMRDSGASRFFVTIYAQQGSGMSEEIQKSIRKKSYWFVIHLGMPFTPFMRIWEALRPPVAYMAVLERSLDVVRGVLSSKTQPSQVTT